MKTQKIVILVLIGLVVLAAFSVYKELNDRDNPNPAAPNAPDDKIPKRVSVVGFWECLPHRDTSGPQTMECAFGLKEEATGKHYGIDTQLMSTYPADFASNTKVKVEGVLISTNQLSSNFWQKYQIEGIISATTITQI